MIDQVKIQLNARKRGIYLITEEINDLLAPFPEKGLLNLFILHTSAALTINENADPDVRHDFEKYLDLLIQENLPFLKHTVEGPDDMPAHVKASMMDISLTIPIINGQLALGTWQGIYLCEFRNKTHQRNILATIYS